MSNVEPSREAMNDDTSIKIESSDAVRLATEKAKSMYRQKLYGKTTSTDEPSSSNSVQLSHDLEANHKTKTESKSAPSLTSTSSQNSKLKELEEYLLLVQRAVAEGHGSIGELTGADEDASILRYDAEEEEGDNSNADSTYEPLFTSSDATSLSVNSQGTSLAESTGLISYGYQGKARRAQSHIVYYCACCGTVSLVANKPILSSKDIDKKFHTRPEDGSTIVPEDFCGLKRFTKSERVRYITRALPTSSNQSNQASAVAAVETGTTTTAVKTGVEKQARYHCKSCDLPLFYRFPPQKTLSTLALDNSVSNHQKKLTYTYILPGALTDNPNQAKVLLEAGKKMYLANQS